MFNHELYAASFARAVAVMRAMPPDVEARKAALRALVALGDLASATLRLYDGVLSVDDIGIPDDVPHVGTLAGRMAAHDIAEVVVGRGAAPAELLALLQGIAADSGEKSVKERLRDAASTRIMVILSRQPATGGRRAESVTQAFESASIQAAMTAPAAPPEAEGEKVEWFEPSSTVVEMDLGEDVAADTVRDAEQHGDAAPAVAETTPAAPVQPPAVDLPDAIPVSSHLGRALSMLLQSLAGGDLLEQLTRVADEVQSALREDKIEAAVDAIALVIALEADAPEGTVRNSYGIMLKRMLPREALVQIARFVADPRRGEAAARVMQRRGSDSTDVLLGLLATAESSRERRAFSVALRRIPEGTGLIVQMLGHETWFVARNVAEVAGELQLEEAVPELGRLLTHADARVRRAAAVALAKIGTKQTMEPLLRLLKEGAPELRALVASSIGGERSRALAMPLVVLANEETDPAVVAEYYRALGRIGTADAVQALAKAAQPGGMLIGRRASGARVAAVEGLRLAGGQAAAAALRLLAADGDKAVRELAGRALEEIKSRG
jgi:hypothetical protein